MTPQNMWLIEKRCTIAFASDQTLVGNTTAEKSQRLTLKEGPESYVENTQKNLATPAMC